jgi:hypothetical protein
MKHGADLIDSCVAETTMPSMDIGCVCRGTAGDLTVRQHAAGLVRKCVKCLTTWGHMCLLAPESTRIWPAHCRAGATKFQINMLKCSFAAFVYGAMTKRQS